MIKGNPKTRRGRALEAAHLRFARKAAILAGISRKDPRYGHLRSLGIAAFRAGFDAGERFSKGTQ